MLNGGISNVMMLLGTKLLFLSIFKFGHTMQHMKS